MDDPDHMVHQEYSSGLLDTVRPAVPWHDAGFDEELIAVCGKHRKGHPERRRI